MGVGSGSGTLVDPERQRGEISGNPGGIPSPPEANFDKMLSAIKGKLINWSTCRLSLAGRILVANQVLLASMWYLAASWNLNPRCAAMFEV
jgi:hypothetical protein